MNKAWFVKEAADYKKVKKLADELGVAQEIAHLLVQRGIENFDDAKNFFRPDWQQLYNPYLMQDMDKAIERLHKAILNNEKILIYGDYDVDGTTAVALVYGFLKNYYPNLEYYIPDRYAEGYGISFKGVDFAAANNYTLVIALDCGVKAIDKIKYANEKNIDFIICDHHLPGESLPDCIVLDPKRNDCSYPYKELSGCGIGFKLMQAFCMKQNIPFENLYAYIDLVVTSIASDIVPITGENRTLAYFGLKKINQAPSCGIKALMDISGKKGPMSISDLVFIIGPRINAAGRLDSAGHAVKLLISRTIDEANDKAKLLNDNNSDRIQLDKQITQDALQLITEQSLTETKTTVLYKSDWHKGVIGIVASRLTEYYYRPTILFAKSNGMLTGSARSVKNYDVHAAIEQCAHLLEQFGGHKYAAGLTLKPENFEAFRQHFEEIVASTILPEQLIPSIDIDLEINFETIKPGNQDELPKFYRILKQFAPFGPGNMNPVFVTRNVKDAGYARIVKEEHLKLLLYSDHNPNLKIPAIGFGLARFFDYVSSGKTFDIAYTLEENTWNEKTSVQIIIKDIKPN
jgi:single-stranded-DNA-specific exonuclease